MLHYTVVDVVTNSHIIVLCFAELYFLIQKFLAVSPLTETYKVNTTIFCYYLIQASGKLIKNYCLQVLSQELEQQKVS